MDNKQLFTPENVRHLLLQSALAVVTGRLTPKEANSIAALTAEIHKSLKMEYIGKVLEGPLRNEQAIEAIRNV